MRISRKEAFSFGLARKLLAHYEGTPLHLDMRSVLDRPHPKSLSDGSVQCSVFSVQARLGP